jgi:nitrite reductase/ring-hydroxylating ferredoxin subunit
VPTPTPGQVLAATRDVPVGGGILTSASVLVLQLRVGEFTAFNATCPHQFFLVRPPDADGIMTCTGHQSKFRAADGVRVDGPATHNLTPVPVHVSGSDVVVA